MSIIRSSRFARVILPTFAWMIGLHATGKAQDVLWRRTGPSNWGLTFGETVRSGGDIDGDGIWDVIAGDPDYTDTLGYSTGGAWVFSGVDGTLLYFLSPNSGAQEFFGTGVAIGPDIDGDGHADFLVTAPLAAPAGAAYLYSGSDGKVKWSLKGSTGNNIGGIAAVVRDYDSDGLVDFAISGRTSAKVVKILSSASGSEITTISDLSVSPGDFGAAIANAGDVNADGVDDLIVGDPFDSTKNVRAGAAFVFSGADGSEIYELYEQETDARFGASVAGLGDRNGDGCSEFIVAAPHASNGNGKAVVYSGKDGSVLRTFVGASSASFGICVANAGDMNVDGIADLYIGAGDPPDGAVRLFSGRDGTFLYHFSTFREPFGTGFGKSCADLGDVDGDGRPDLVVSAPYAAAGSGAICAISGNDWFLDVSDKYPIAGETVTFSMALTNAGSLAGLFLVDVNLVPTPAPLAIGHCDGTGRYIVSGSVPSGLTGVNVALLSIGVDPAGRLVDSSVEWIFFQ